MPKSKFVQNAVTPLLTNRPVRLLRQMTANGQKRTLKSNYMDAVKLLKTVAVALPLLLGMHSPVHAQANTFDIVYTEEVRLNDGGIVVIDMKRTYERRGFIAKSSPVERSVELSFDAGAPVGRVTQRIIGGDFFFLGRDGADWYLGMYGRSGTPIPVSANPTVVNFYKIVTSQSADRLTSNVNIPDAFETENILPPTPDGDQFSRFNNRHISLTAKSDYWSAHPRGAGDPFMKLRKYDHGSKPQVERR